VSIFALEIPQKVRFLGVEEVRFEGQIAQVRPKGSCKRPKRVTEGLEKGQKGQKGSQMLLKWPVMVLKRSKRSKKGQTGL
jgi:hypothetical protein